MQIAVRLAWCEASAIPEISTGTGLPEVLTDPPLEVIVMRPSWLRSKLTFAGSLLRGSWLRLMREEADSASVTQAIGTAADHALAAEEDAAILECLLASGGDMGRLAPRLVLIEHHAKDLFQDAIDLRALEGRGELWQMETTCFVRPLLYSLACQLDAMSHRFGGGDVPVCQPSTADYLHGLSELAGRTASLIHDLVEWGRDNAEIERMQRPLTSTSPRGM